MLRTVKATLRAPRVIGRSIQKRQLSVAETEEWALFPREKEGNVYFHNWSLVEDGVVPVGNAFRNARLPIITNQLGVKSSATMLDLKEPMYTGDFVLNESGDSISHDEFNELLTNQQQYLSSGVDLYVEDAALGVNRTVRNGARVITDSPATALIVRSLLAGAPPVEVDHRARFKGWNFDPRWTTEPIWAGDHFILPEEQTDPLPGQRPLVAFVGGPGQDVAVQFVENSSEIVGANVVVGGSAPVGALVAALGHAATVLVNEQNADAVAVPSTSVIKGKDTILIIGSDDAVIDAAAASGGSLFGAYHNIMTPHGVSAMWNGYIGAVAADKSKSTANTGAAPLVSVGGKAAQPITPDNLAFSPKQVIIYENGAKKGKLSVEEAVKRVVALTDEGKADAAAALLKDADIKIAGKPADLKSML